MLYTLKFKSCNIYFFIDHNIHRNMANTKYLSWCGLFFTFIYFGYFNEHNIN